MTKLVTSTPTRPPNIYCFGRTYAKHAKELCNPVPSEPVVFLKATSSLRSLNWDGEYPPALLASGLHYESEVVLRVGPDLSGVGIGKIDAVALGLDLTDREKQNELKSSGLPWALAKSFRGAAVVSEFSEIQLLPSWSDWTFEFLLEGSVVQSGSAAQMLFALPFMVDFLHEKFGLLEGDLIFTGTPSGVGECSPGQKITLRGLGKKEFSGIL